MQKNRKVAIVGCGVSGLSTALILRKSGWDVTILSKDDPRTAALHPEFASLYPAASIVPHSVSGKKLQDIFRRSQEYFQKLYDQQFPGLNLYDHFELFAAQDQPLHDYLSLLKKVRVWDEFKTEFHPKHPSIPVQTGWKFNCFFADWSLYFPALISMVLEHEVDFRQQELTAEDILKLPFDHIINCSGLGTVKLFCDSSDLIYRGHILRIPEAPPLLDPDGNIVSYNFTPTAEIYTSESGITQDVYYYPRSNGWVLGGSRQRGRIDEAGNWIGEVTQEPFNMINNLKIPTQILEIHSSIIQHTFGAALTKFPAPEAKMGYRYLRKEEDGLRIEAEELDDKLVIHNYGHGGAGVTLSWGSALEAARLLEEHL